MDRSFKNNADFKMNQQNFKLSDFGIEMKSGHESKTVSQNNLCKVRRGAQVSQRYVHAENAHVLQISGRLASGSNLLQVACNRSRTSPLMTSNGNQHRNSSSQLGQLQNAAAAAADRFQTSSPSNLSGTGPIMQLSSSPSYWKQYGGQESGVNIARGIERSVYRDSEYRGNTSFSIVDNNATSGEILQPDYLRCLLEWIDFAIVMCEYCESNGVPRIDHIASQ